MSIAARALVPLAVLAVACGGDDAAVTMGTGGGHTRCTDCAEAGANAASGGAAQSGAGEGGDAEIGGSGHEAGAAGEAGAPDDRSTTNGVTISEISFWQTVRVPLELSGASAQRNAPLVTGKPGIVRVFVAPGAGYRTRQLSATLSLGSGVNALPATSSKVILKASENGDFGTTFNFPLDGSSVLAMQSYSVVLRDGPDGAVLDRYPSTGTATLATDTAGPTLNVVVVPLIVAGVTPDTSPSTLAKLRARVLSLYPLADFTLTAHTPVVSNIAVGPDSGWDETLDGLYTLRAQDAPPDNTYYFGLFTPAKSFDDYCVSDCTVGLSQVAGPNEVEYRGSIGLGIFADGSNADAADTMAHELGHALGRQHSPCMVSAPAGYPYAGGKIGVWGFDSLNHLLLDPALYGDVMGYCSPDWISDYTYRALFNRIQYVNGFSAQAEIERVGSPKIVYRRVLVDARGSLHWGARFEPSDPTSGQAEPVILLGAQGQELGNVAGYARSLSDEKSAFVLVPEAALDPQSGVSAIRVRGAELALDASLP